MAYARWVADTVAVDRGKEKVVEGGFGQMPEVRTLLEEKLAPDDNGGFAARAVYGRSFGLLFQIDREWLRNHAQQIFDLRHLKADPATAYGWAAWNTFLSGTHPHVESYRILRDQFSYAVDQAATIQVKESGFDQPFEHLGEHLMVLYGRGNLTLDDDRAIIRRFLTTAVLPIRTHAIEFIGRSLSEDTPGIPAEVTQRFMDLWEWYWEAIGREDAKSGSSSFLFGYWFSSGVFDKRWSLDRLEQFVEIVPKPEPDSEILERLVEIAQVAPARACRVAQLMVEGDDEGWRIYTWREHAKSVLAQGMQAGGPARDTAEQVIDQLGRRDYLEFGELLAIER